MLEPTTIATALLVGIVIYQHYQIYIINAEIDAIIEAHNGLVIATADAVSEIKEDLDYIKEETDGY